DAPAPHRPGDRSHRRGVQARHRHHAHRAKSPPDPVRAAATADGAAALCRGAPSRRGPRAFQPMTDFEALLRALCAEGVRFLVIGGAAATAHGSARLTTDLDVIYARDADNIRRLAAALAPVKRYLREAPPGLPPLAD